MQAQESVDQFARSFDFFIQLANRLSQELNQLDDKHFEIRIRSMADRTTMESWPDSEIVEKAKACDKDAFLIFCDRNLPKLLPLVKRDCNEAGFPEFRAKDVCHDAIIKAVAFVVKKQKAGGSLTDCTVAWLRQIARRLMLDEMRREKRNFELENVNFEPRDTNHDIEEIEQQEVVKSYFDWLRPEQSELCRRVIIDEVKIKDVAKEFGISVDAAHKRFQRAMETLRDLITQNQS